MAALVMVLVLVGGWVEIEDAAPRACLDAARVESRVADSLGRALPSGQSRAWVEVRRIGDSLGARIELLDEDGAVVGTREIAARAIRCRQMEDAVVLHLVLALDQQAQPVPALTVAPDPVPAAEPPAAAVAVARVAVPIAPPARGPDWQAYAGAGGVAGALPGFGLGPMIGAGARWGRLSLAAEGRLDWGLPTQTDGVRIQSGRATAGLLACTQPWQLGVCLGPRMGLLRVSRGGSATSPTLDVTGRLTLGLGRSAALYAEPALALVRTRLHADGRRVWTTPPLSLAAGVMIWRQ